MEQMQRNPKTIRQGFEVLGRRYGDAFGNQVELDIRPSVNKLQPRKLDQTLRNLAFDIRGSNRLDFNDMARLITRDRAQCQVGEFIEKHAVPSPHSKALINRSKHGLVNILRSLGGGHTLVKAQGV